MGCHGFLRRSAALFSFERKRNETLDAQPCFQVRIPPISKFWKPNLQSFSAMLSLLTAIRSAGTYRCGRKYFPSLFTLLEELARRKLPSKSCRGSWRRDG